MRLKVLVGSFLAATLAFCPFVADAASAPQRSGAHSCCAASHKGPAKSSVPAKSDCCLRAPAHGQAMAANSRLDRSSSIVVAEGADRVASRDAQALPSDLSPPSLGLGLGLGLAPSTSPRSPPLPA